MCSYTRSLWADLQPGRMEEIAWKRQGWRKLGRSPAAEPVFISEVMTGYPTAAPHTPDLQSLRHKFEQIFHDLTVSVWSTASSAPKTHSCAAPLLWQRFMSVNELLQMRTELPLQMPRPCSAQSPDCVVPGHSLLLAGFFPHLMEVLREPLREKQEHCTLCPTAQ